MLLTLYYICNYLNCRYNNLIKRNVHETIQIFITLWVTFVGKRLIKDTMIYISMTLKNGYTEEIYSGLIYTWENIIPIHVQQEGKEPQVPY